MGPALQSPDAYLIATNNGIMRINQKGDSVDGNLVSVGTNKINQFRDNGNGYLLAGGDYCGWDTTMPCSIYLLDYRLERIKKVSWTQYIHTNVELLYSHLDSVYFSLVNRGSFVSYDFMKTWNYISAKGDACSMNDETSGYVEDGNNLYLANRSGLFLYKPFELTTENIFCNKPEHYSGYIRKYKDSLIVSDSGNVFRISKIGENSWSKYPLPEDYSPETGTCTLDLFSTYMVFQSQKLGCLVEDSIKISVYDLKERKVVKTFTNSEWKYQINYTTTADKLIVNLGPSGIAVYDENLREKIYKNSACGTTGISSVHPAKVPTKKHPKKYLLNGRVNHRIGNR